MNPIETLAETQLCSLMRIYSNFSPLSTMCDIRLFTMINVHWILDICGFSISDKVSHEIIVAGQRPINDHKSQWIQMKEGEKMVDLSIIILSFFFAHQGVGKITNLCLNHRHRAYIARLELSFQCKLAKIVSFNIYDAP